MKDLWLTNGGELCDFLESEMANGNNPSTPEEWEKTMKKFLKLQKAKFIGSVEDEMTPGYIAGSLRDEGINAQVFKPIKKQEP